MVLSENRYPLFGIMRPRRECGGNCHTGPYRRKAKPRRKTVTCAYVWQADNDAMTRAGVDDKKAKKTGRLAAALRENLRRRKAQLRQRGARTPDKRS
jgi:hypothetical protein